ncbi:MAG: glutathione S-transferase family protein [Pseudohongiellaceae bacterium]
MQLVIGSKNYSSWSMRPWMLLSHFDLDFKEVKVALFKEGYKRELAKYSPTGKVPVLLDGGIEIWDSLAICEYVSEQYLGGAGWPQNLLARARCRAVSAEMHSSFTSIRTELPMNCRAKRKLAISSSVKKEIARIDEIWAGSIESSGGPYLFGEFSIADCMYAPIVSRFETYNVNVSVEAQQYSRAIIAHPSFKAWMQAAAGESEVIQIGEVGEDMVEDTKQ